MASRTIAIRITIDNRDAINQAKAQVIAMRGLSEATKKHTHLQHGLTNSFLAGNLAARAISVAYTSIANSLKFVISEAVNFEFAMAKIVAITDASTVSTRILEKAIRGVALETHQSQSEVAAAALEMGKMGFSALQVENALGAVIKLGRGLDENLAETGKTVISILNAYGKSASEAEKVTNELAFTVKASALDINTFATAFGYVAGTAADSKVSLTELMAAMDVLSNAGVRSSTVGTQLRRIITDLADSHSKASKVLGGKVLSDTYTLADAFDDLGKKNLKASDYAHMFGKTAGSVASILSKNTGLMRDLNKQTENADNLLDGLNATMLNTLKGAWQGLKTNLSEVGIELNKNNGFLKEAIKYWATLFGILAKKVSLDNQINAFKAAKPESFNTAVDQAFKTQFPNNTFDPIFAETLKKGIANNNELISQTKEYRQYLVQLAREELRERLKIAEADKKNLENRKLASDAGLDKETENIIYGGRGKRKRKLNRASVFMMDLAVQNADTITDFAASQKATREQRKEEFQTLLALAEYDKRIRELSLHYQFFLQLQSQLTTSFNTLSDAIGTNLVNSLFQGAAAWKNFGDTVGDTLKSLAAQIISTLIKMMLFKALAAAFGVGTTGMGFNIGANLFQSAVLSSLGGQPGGNFQPRASGVNQIITTPTLFKAGEAGAEKLRITPASKMSQKEDSKPVNFNIYGDIYDYDRFARKVQAAQGRNRKSFV